VTAESLKPQIEKIDSMIAADVARNPIGSVTVGIVSGKQLIWTKSYGDGDMEKKIPATPIRCTASDRSPKCSPR
jgi:CubicO group peptidase (beta-lactamase class C family)